MKKIVSLVQREFAAAFLDRTKTGVIDFPRSRVIRQNALEEGKGGVRVGSHGGMHNFRLGLVHQPGYLIDIGFVGDVFVKAARILSGAHERHRDGGWNFESTVGKEENVAAFQYCAVISSFVGVLELQSLSVSLLFLPRTTPARVAGCALLFWPRTTPGRVASCALFFFTAHNARPSGGLSGPLFTPHNAGPSGELCAQYLPAEAHIINAATNRPGSRRFLKLAEGGGGFLGR